MVESTSPVIWTESYLSITYLIPVDLSPLCTSRVLLFYFFFFFKFLFESDIILDENIKM